MDIGPMFGYALRGANKSRNEFWTAVGGGGLIGLLGIIVGRQMTLPQWISENAVRSSTALLVICVLAAQLVVFLARLAYWPVHCKVGPHGGLLAIARAKFGAQMWPILLMVSSVPAFVILFSAGAIWFLVSARGGSDQVSQPEPMIQPNLSLVTTKDVYLFNWDSKDTLQIRLRKENEIGQQNYAFPSFILKKQNSVSVADLTITWRANIAGIMEILKSSQAFEGVNINDRDNLILLQDKENKRTPFGYPISTTETYPLAFVNKDTPIFIPLKLYDVLTLFLAARMPSENGSRTEPITFSVFIDWNIPEGGKTEAFKVTAIATNTTPTNIENAPISAAVDFKVEKLD